MLPGVGLRTERRIRREGIERWDDFLGHGGVRFASPTRNELWCELLARWQEALARRDERFFKQRLARREHWRLYEVFNGDVAFLDIETTGQAPPNDETTVVGVYRGGVLTQLVAGQNLSGDAVDAALGGVKLLVTFFGSAFDLPFLQKEFSYLRFDFPHFDLCFGAKRLGVQGGLKKVERLYGLERDADLAGLDGYDAVKLWQAHLHGMPGALEKLLRYNAADTVNLAALADILYERLCAAAAGARPGGVSPFVIRPTNVNPRGGTT